VAASASVKQEEAGAKAAVKVEATEQEAAAVKTETEGADLEVADDDAPQPGGGVQMDTRSVGARIVARHNASALTRRKLEGPAWKGNVERLYNGEFDKTLNASAKWYRGQIVSVVEADQGTYRTMEILYDDGDEEEGVFEHFVVLEQEFRGRAY